jgi:hypothetical protein
MSRPLDADEINHFSVCRTSREATGNARMIPFYENPDYAYTPPRFQHDTIPEKTAGP